MIGFALLGLIDLSGMLSAQTVAEPSLSVCQEWYNPGTQERRLEVTINWNGYRGEGISRFDLGAEDRSNAIWPQLRDNRLRPSARATHVSIVVGDQSFYPLTFNLIGYTAEARKEFDRACSVDGFCSVREDTNGVSIIGGGDQVESETSYKSCGS
ncbi:MAG: hypothetical protein KF730_08565 [Sphingomonas sp.]|uniref:hypothetical protein n=1 Tax=Sphingomonas sp. TaxID=28214 RepID=UPI0025CD231D|nr:hypothetical protein [Sphingomonas sp.]MBX3564612.1 hypothetical protein [Sphingomonas sp.]